jgi:hypothetical protein
MEKEINKDVTINFALPFTTKYMSIEFVGLIKNPF